MNAVQVTVMALDGDIEVPRSIDQAAIHDRTWAGGNWKYLKWVCSAVSRGFKNSPMVV